MMEMYEAYTDYHGMMELCETLFRDVSEEVLGSQKLIYQEWRLTHSPWRRMTMIEAVRDTQESISTKSIQTKGEGNC